MNIAEVKRRLEQHFAIHDDGRPTPYLDEAVLIMYNILNKYASIIQKFGSFDKVMAAETVVHCGECYFFDPDKSLCRWDFAVEPFVNIREGYCNRGVPKVEFEAMLERCRASGGWCTPGVILSADEVKSLLGNKENCDV